MSCDTIQDSFCLYKIDSIVAKQNTIDSLKAIINDNITAETLIKSQQFYNSSFSSFTNIVSVLAVLLVAVSAVLITINFISANFSKREVKRELSKIKDFKTELEKLNKTFKTDRDNMLREIAESYLAPIIINRNLQGVNVTEMKKNLYNIII